MSDENFWLLIIYLFVNNICRSFQLKRIEEKIDKLLKMKGDQDHG